IERAVRIITDKGEIMTRSSIAPACRDDLAVRLDRDRRSYVVGIQNGGGHLACTAEARIERAVRIVTDKGEIIIRPVIAIACCDYLAIRLDSDRVGFVIGTQNVGGDLARTAEARIERAVRIVTDKGEISIRPVIAIACRNYLAVRLD